MLEAVAWAAGIVCLAYVGVRHMDSVNSNRESMRRFAELTAEHRRGGSVDVTLWSEARIAAWHRTRDRSGPTPLAILRIPRIGLEVPVLEGTDELTLNRALGHIEDTALPGVDGNIGIAGHRDGFFRALMNVVPGDAIEVEALHGTEQYTIERTWIVTPDDVSVLDPTTEPSVTLVTCYPFYFVGSAPQRFIVRAVRTGAWKDLSAAHRLVEPPTITGSK
jgi:sortase A